ncbi:hypothetical protein [Carp edema virus]|nr:hypothetical protein [Carp edema virus]
MKITLGNNIKNVVKEEVVHKEIEKDVKEVEFVDIVLDDEEEDESPKCSLYEITLISLMILGLVGFIYSMTIIFLPVPVDVKIEQPKETYKDIELRIKIINSIPRKRFDSPRKIALPTMPTNISGNVSTTFMDNVNFTTDDTSEILSTEYTNEFASENIINSDYDETSITQTTLVPLEIITGEYIADIPISMPIEF